MRFHLALLLAGALPLVLGAQEKRLPGDVMIEKYLAAETDKLSQKFLDGAKTLDEWKQKRPRLHQEYLYMLGLWPLPEKTPLKATRTGAIEAHGVVVEKVHFQSKPGLYVTANVYRPRNESKRRLPAIVYVCGHSNRGRDGNKSAYQDHGFWFANNGYVCIILDTLQLGEIPGIHHGTYGRIPPRWWWHSRGYTPAGVEAWNGIRAIDYLCTRADVDPDKIGVTGISGGGAATFWIAAADERVKVAVPVSGMSDLESYVKNKVINGHCDCMFLYNTYQWDWTTIAALVAPRPLLFANSDNDPIFPMDANRRIIAKLKKIYGMYAQPNLVDEYVSTGGHAYRPDLRIAVFKFLNKHLKGDTSTPVEDSAKYTPLKGRELRVFPEDSDVPKDALNGRIDETFVPAAKVTLPEKGKFAEWKKEMIGKLEAESFRERNKVPLPQLHKIRYADGGTSQALNYGGRFGIETKPLFDKGKTEVVWIASSSDSSDKSLPFLKDKNVRLMFLSGSQLSVFSATRKSPPNYVERSHVLLGQTVHRNDVRDVHLLRRYLFENEEAWPVILGAGNAGILAVYAGLLGPPPKEVVVIDPPKSHKEGPYFLNVMRVLDIPEALGLLAPTPLTIIGGNDPAFDRTAEIYRLAGAADKLTRK